MDKANLLEKKVKKILKNKDIVYKQPDKYRIKRYNQETVYSYYK